MNMLKIIAATSVFASLAFAAKAPVTAKPLALDTATSVIKWVGSKPIGTKHNGTVLLKSGSITVEKKKISGGEFTIDLSTIKDLDLTDEGYNKKLVGHLKSPDFFDLEKHPTATFKITKAVAGKGDDYKISGDLTIKGITKPISFDAKVTEVKGVYSANGKIKINRTDWDLKYNSGKFFDPKALGDKLINDEIELEIDLKTSATGA